ncbi:MAG: VOC family protein [Candidatus Eisenbacteria bacterium]|uniref:VOC family protein n=1 Tax=Eiseniibacteriota bacterium TaxID=2212470 RepID=A0A849SRN2_UNCEI|nr:VOC family protein [Candidatus Eisenbacteria bacterium]
MNLRFDHAVVIVDALEPAVRHHEDAGFTVVPGGRHDVLPTENALIAFADGSYLELLAFRDATTRDELLRLAGSPRWDAHLQSVSAIARRFLPRLVGAQGVADWVLAGSGLDRFASESRRRGEVMTGPFRMSRARPDGQSLEWDLLMPSNFEAPIFIEDRTARELRVPADGAATSHPNGARGVVGVTVRVPSVPAAALRLARLFDVAPRAGADGSTTLWIAGVQVELLAGEPVGAVAVRLDGLDAAASGPGLGGIHAAGP